MKLLYSALAITAVIGSAEMASATAEKCASSVDLAPAGVTLTEAVYLPKGEGSAMDHCKVSGIMAERTGMDGQNYALRFEIRLPDEWTNRFMHQFNGGADGTVQPALGNYTGSGAESALERGFAIVSSDAGHQRDARPDKGLASGTVFGFDYEARRMYGYGAVEMLHPVALEITEKYYGEAPKYVYGFGTSNGGRHGMVALSRMPGAFDGILSGYPGFDLPRTGIQSALDIQTFRSVGQTLKDAYTKDELNFVSASINAVCDELDGLKDGVVNATAQCQAAFDPTSMLCSDGQNSECLSADKVAGLVTVHRGPVTDAGEQLYNNWYWDPGINSGSWRFWKLESPIPPWDFKPLIATLAAGAVMNIFDTPPNPVETGSSAELEEFMNNYDWQNAYSDIFATTKEFPQSAMQMIAAPNWNNPYLTEFADVGGKFIVYHGSADPIFSMKNIEDWHNKLQYNNPKAASFERYYPIPGMPHGEGGNSADQIDLLGALIDWVEKEQAPGVLEAKFRADNPEAGSNAGATRPLCPYPFVAHFNGGDAMLSSSFSCK